MCKQLLFVNRLNLLPKFSDLWFGRSEFYLEIIFWQKIIVNLVFILELACFIKNSQHSWEMEIFFCWLIETNLQSLEFWSFCFLSHLTIVAFYCMNIRIESSNVFVASTTQGERKTWYSVNGHRICKTNFSCFDKFKVVHLLSCLPDLTD